jgi:superoxide reductase
MHEKRRFTMKRRDFIKGALLTTAALTSRRAFAGEGYGDMSTMEGLNRLQDEKNPTVSEQKHVPGIVIPDTVKPGTWFDVKVKVGFLKEHPSTAGHWITMIKLHADNRELAWSHFRKGGVTAPVATFRIRLDRTTTLQAIENCNIHGTWISSPVEVKVV